MRRGRPRRGGVDPERAFSSCPDLGSRGPNPSPHAESLGNVWPSFLLIPQCGALVFSVCR